MSSTLPRAGQQSDGSREPLDAPADGSGPENAPPSSTLPDLPPPSAAPSSTRGGPSPAAHLAGWLGRASGLRVGLSGATAWVVTVAPAALAPGGRLAPKLLAAAGIVPVVAASTTLRRHPTVGRHLGLTVFPAMCVGAWLWAAAGDKPIAPDIYRAVLGALAWAVYALSWVHPWSLSDDRLATAPAGKAAGFAPRRRPSPWSTVIAAGSVAASVGLLCVGWLAAEPTRAVLAHALAVGGAISLVTVACGAAVLAGRGGEGGRRWLTAPVVKSLVMVVVTGALVVLAVATRP